MLGINFLLCLRILAAKVIVWKFVFVALILNLVFLQSFTCLLKFYPWIPFRLFRFSHHIRFPMSFFNFLFGSFILLKITIYDLGVLIADVTNYCGLPNKHVLVCNQVDKKLSLFFSDYVVFFGSVCDEWLLSYLVNRFEKLLKLKFNIYTRFFKIILLELETLLIFFSWLNTALGEKALVHNNLELISQHSKLILWKVRLFFSSLICLVDLYWLLLRQRLRLLILTNLLILVVRTSVGLLIRFRSGLIDSQIYTDL